MMKDLLKDQYSLPTCRVYEVHLTKVIAVSGTGNESENFTEEGGTW